MQEILKLKRKHADHLLGKENVVSVGVGFREMSGVRTEQVCIVAGVEKKLPGIALPTIQQLPVHLEGVKVDVQEVGKIKALERTGRYRPAPGGVSIGHVDVTAGTLGCLVARDGEAFILSNNHVLAASNKGKQDDPIVQPGPHDGGVVDTDKIATLEDWVPIRFI